MKKLIFGKIKKIKKKNKELNLEKDKENKIQIGNQLKLNLDQKIQVEK